MMSLKQIKLLLVLMLIGTFVIGPAIAQDAEETEVPPIEATEAPIIIDYGDDVPGIAGINWYEWFDRIVITIIMGSLVFLAYSKWKEGGDVALSEFVDDVGEDRPRMEQAERWHGNQSSDFQLAFNSMAQLMEFLGVVTNLQTPTSIANVIRDIQQPGPPIPAAINARVMSNLDRINDEDERFDEAPQ